MNKKESEQHIQDQVEKTLQAYHHLPALEPNPYLFIRIQTTLASAGKRRGSFLLNRIKLKPLALALMILMNILTAVYVFTQNEKSARQQLISSLDKDYSTQDEYFDGY